MTTTAEALARLRAGNARYVAARSTHPRQDADRRAEVAAGQQPYALVLACADSRVPPEVVFDEGLGDLFVVRSAGQVLDDSVIGSVQYAVAELEIPLVLVLGHQRCSAVLAAVEAVEKDSEPTGTDIDTLVDAIKPAVEQAEREKSRDMVDAAVRNNIGNIVAQLRKQRLVRNAVADGRLGVVGARYDLETGRVASHNKR